MQPETFGRYKLVSLLGEGGMAKVYLAVLSGPMGFEKEVALKKIDTRLTQDDRFVKALINEARLGGQLRHKNIVEVYEFNQVGEDYYLAMEYVNGWTLDAVIRDCRNAGKQIPPGVVLQIAEQLCRGLEYAHELRSKDGSPMNLVHRDLKPANVIVSKGGDAKIMDFGIAKADSNLYKTTAADITKGTPIYMSPEQVTGSARLTGRSDIFSMGSILHELLMLDVIFHGDNLLAIMHKVLQADIRGAVKNVEQRVPGLADVLKKAMAKKPEDRYESAGAMGRDLQRVLESLGPQPSIYEWLQEYQSWIPKKPSAGEAAGKGHPKGTQSLAGMSDSTDAELGDFTQAFFTQGDQAAGEAAPQLRPTGAPPAGPHAEQEMGELTKQFFQTGAEPSVPPSTGAPTQLEAEQRRAQQQHLTSAPIRPAYAEPEPRKKRGGLGLLIGVLVAVIVLLMAAVGGVIVVRMMNQGGRTVDDVTDPGAGQGGADAGADAGDGTDAGADAADGTDAGADAADGGEQEGMEPDSNDGGDAAADGGGAGATDAGSTVPHDARHDGGHDAGHTDMDPGRGKPIDTQITTPPEPVTPPPPPPDPPVATGTAKMTVNAKPWAVIYLDGNLIANTPVKGYEITSGSHTLTLKCGPCKIEQEKTITFSVDPGETYSSVRNTFQQE